MAEAVQTLTFGQLRGILSGLGLRMSQLDLIRPLGTVGLYLAAQARRSFDESRAPDGTPWRALKSPSKRRGGASAKPLIDFGLLMASYTSQGASHVSRPSAAALMWGSADRRASFHQDGTKRIPARPALGVTGAMQARIMDIVIDDFERQLKGR